MRQFAVEGPRGSYGASEGAAAGEEEGVGPTTRSPTGGERMMDYLFRDRSSEERWWLLGYRGGVVNPTDGTGAGVGGMAIGGPQPHLQDEPPPHGYEGEGAEGTRPRGAWRPWRVALVAASVTLLAGALVTVGVTTGVYYSRRNAQTRGGVAGVHSRTAKVPLPREPVPSLVNPEPTSAPTAARLSPTVRPTPAPTPIWTFAPTPTWYTPAPTAAPPTSSIRIPHGQPSSSATSPNPAQSLPGCPSVGSPPPGRRYVQIKNNCKETVWPGVVPPGAFQPPDHRWAWQPGECKTMEVASILPSLRVWARTKCDSMYRCLTGSCNVDGAGMCLGAGEAPCTLWEATLQDHCSPTGQYASTGNGPDFYDASLVDGFNVGIKVVVSGGWDVGGVPQDYSCQEPQANTLNPHACPFELRVYSDQIPGLNLPVEGWLGLNRETSPCFKTPLDPECQKKIVGCRSLCKSVDQGWIGWYIDNVQGPRDLVDPVLTRPNGAKIRWSQQFLQGRDKCGDRLCMDSPAWGAFRGEAYSTRGFMKNLVCCDFGFRCSPYQSNDVPGGCPYEFSCPTLGAADPLSPFHRQASQDTRYPQYDQVVRMSSALPDWPMPTHGGNYARIYKESSPEAYSWQFGDADATYTCCGKTGESGPSYLLTFCPD